MNKVLHFDLDTSLIKIKKIMENKDFIELEFKAISDEYPNNNKSHFPYHTFDKNINAGLFYNKPILGKFNNVTNNYETHNYRKKYDPELELEYYDYEDGERPLGLIRESDNIRVETDENGLHWIVFSAVLWVKYNYRGVKKLLLSKNGKISVEVTVLQSHEDENGIEIFDEWVFDGVTILGYRPNTTVPVSTGINNAKFNIKDVVNKSTFSNQLKSLCFAYEEFDNQDIKETQSHLYKNNDEMEGCEMSIEEFNEKIEEFKEKEEPVNDEKECKMNNKDDIKEDECGTTNSFENDSKEDECNDFEKTDGKKEDECGTTGFENSKEDECNTKDEDDPKTDECNKFEEQKDMKSDIVDDLDDDKEDPDNNSDDKDDKDDSPDRDDECNKFSLNNELFTGEELVNKYIVDMEEKNKDYETLQEKFSELLTTKQNLEEKIKKYEEKEAQVKMQALCEKISDIANRKGFNESEVNNLVERCKKGEFADEESAIKEIAYIIFTKELNNEQSIDTTNTHVEFSAKVEVKQDNTKVDKKKKSFESL